MACEKYCASLRCLSTPPSYSFCVRQITTGALVKNFIYYNKVCKYQNISVNINACRWYKIA